MTRPRLAAAVLLVVVVKAVMSFPRLAEDAPSYDEWKFLRYGRQLLLDGTGQRTGPWSDSKLPAQMTQALPGVLFERGWLPGLDRLIDAIPRSERAPLDVSLLAGRLVTWTASLLLVAAVAAWSWQLWGPRGACLSALLATLCPNLTTHAGFVTGDLLFALTVVLVCWAFERYVHVGGWRPTLCLGLAWGAALCAKYTAPVLIPLQLVLALACRPANRPLRRLALDARPRFLPYSNLLIQPKTTAYRTFAGADLAWGQAHHDLLGFLERHADEGWQLDPPTPVRGRVIVDVNLLAGVDCPPERYAWLRRHHPIGHVAHAYLLFELP